MHRRITQSWATVTASLCLCPAALAQLDLSWYTIDTGGGASSAGTLTLYAVIGQHDAGRLAAGALECFGGFIGGAAAPPCYANCDQSTGSPLLTANDFQCFINRFAAASSQANCDGSTGTPSLTANDFQCFINAYAAGCTA